ncbi:MAG: GNAT family N-acetyltransferase [Rhodothermales bacterium]
MISFHPLPDSSSIRDVKAAYLGSLLAPMDGMWESGITDPAPHWEIRLDGVTAGYYAANGAGTLLQFYILPAFERQARRLFDRVIAQDTIDRAVVSTIDPAFLTLCLDVQKGIAVHTYLYEAGEETPLSQPAADRPLFRAAEADELERVVAFQQACLGGEADLSGWLRGYSTTLIERGELFVLAHSADWIGLGEYRKSGTQSGIVDLGMMVAPERRGAGWATYILALLRQRSGRSGHKPICSTTVDNVGAQKAITRAGFISRHRILDVTL